MIRTHRCRTNRSVWNRKPAEGTSRELYDLARSYLDLRRHLSEEPWLTRRELEAALQGEHRNCYHRIGDELVGYFDLPSGHSELSILRAYLRLYPRRERS